MIGLTESLALEGATRNTSFKAIALRCMNFARNMLRDGTPGSPHFYDEATRP